MKTEGILYTGNVKKHSSNRFLSKRELRLLFNPEAVVTMTVFYRRKSMRIAVKKEGKYVCRRSYPRTRAKSRIINL